MDSIKGLVFSSPFCFVEISLKSFRKVLDKYLLSAIIVSVKEIKQWRNLNKMKIGFPLIYQMSI